MRVLDLFSGIGGFALAGRNLGHEIAAFCERAKYPRLVLEKQFHGVPIFDDVTTADFTSIGPVDLVTAGFPCQDTSRAGNRAGLAGERSGLFWYILRAVRMVGRPRLLLENVAGLLDREMGTVLGALAEIGYDAEWHCIPASHVGAPHDRDRVWIIADPIGGERREEPYYRALGRMGRQQQSVPWDEQWEGALRRLRGMDDGLSYGVDRVDTLRNAIVPQVAEGILKAID